MYIGASSSCKEYCEEEAKAKFQKYHKQQRHTVLETKVFQEENKDFMRKSRRAWNNFAIKLESFFKKFKKQIEFIEKEALNRLEYEQVKTAISTNDKYLAKISTDIMQERYRNLTCQDIDQFLKLRKKQQNVSELSIQKEESQFSTDILSQISECFKEVSKDLIPQKDVKSKRKNDQHQQTPRAKKEEEPQHKKQNTYKHPNKYKAHNKFSEDYSDPDTVKPSQTHTKQPLKREEQKRYNRDRDDSSSHTEKKEKRSSRQPEDKKKENISKDSCPFLKICDLSEANKAFSIEIKLVQYIKQLYDKQLWRVCDETGQIKLIVPHHKLLKQGSKITLKNCFIKAFNRNLEIHTKTVTTISSENYKEQQLKFINKNYSKHDNNRRSNRHQKGNQKQENKEIGKGLTKIDQIGPEHEGLKLIAKILKVTEFKTPKDTYRCVLGDETGIINSQFQGFQSLLKEGSVVYFRGLDAKVDTAGHLFLTGKKILMEPAHDGIPKINEKNDVSKREYELLQEEDK